MGGVRESASQQVGRYEILSYLGSGGMSDVYAALHTGLRRRVALKVLRSSLRQDEEAVERFLREGACAARVCHPNVVNVHDVGVDDGVPYLVMELLSGETLDQKLAREGMLSCQQAIELLLPIFDAVEHVHRAGVIHRDVKPSNILLARMVDGTVTPKLVDFGIATVAERRLITGALGPIGTPTYMSPEQARGLDPVDGRSDQYALASILFELITGREAYPGADVDAVLNSVSRGQFPRLGHVVRGVPRGLDDALARATAFHARDRFGSVREFAEALLPFASERTGEAWSEHDGVPGESSGARFSMNVHSRAPGRASTHGSRAPGRASPPRSRDSQATLRLRTSVSGTAAGPVREGRKQKQLVIAGVGALALVLGLAVGVAYSRGQVVSAQPLADAGPAEMAAASAGDAAKASLEQDRPLAPHVLPLVLKVQPDSAESTLDGRLLGRGNVEIPAADTDELHELRVSAEGHVPRVVLFRGAPSSLEVVLQSEGQ